MNTRENRESFDELIEKVNEERQNLQVDGGHQRLLGRLGGSLCGLILSVALFFVLLIIDQNFSKPIDSDFANLVGVVLFVLMSTAISGVLGTASFRSLLHLSDDSEDESDVGFSKLSTTPQQDAVLSCQNRLVLFSLANSLAIVSQSRT